MIKKPLSKVVHSAASSIVASTQFFDGEEAEYSVIVHYNASFAGSIRLKINVNLGPGGPGYMDLYPITAGSAGTIQIPKSLAYGVEVTRTAGSANILVSQYLG